MRYNAFMELGEFKTMYENMTKNITEIKAMLNKTKPETLGTPDGVQVVERIKYLFYGLVKFLVDVGNRIVIDRDLRKPLNNADIFISLAEKKIVMSAAVPGVKKAVLAMPRIGYCSYSEVLQIISESVTDLHKCLDSFAAYFMDQNPAV
jgi:hypothetical protein